MKPTLLERNSAQWEQLRSANSVLMLRNLLKTNDVNLQRAIYEQVCDQEFSHIPEVLDGETRTHFEFEVHNGRLLVMQPNGVVDWLEIHENGVERAKKKAETNQQLKFYADIARVELEEAKAQLAMVEDGQPVTMLAISLDGSDLGTTSDLKSLGRDPEKKRAYLRASVFDGDRLHLYSATFDGLTLNGAKDILGRFGISLPAEANSVDILKARAMISGVHHNLLEQNVPYEGENNYDFVLEQKDLLSSHMKNLIELSRYNLSDAELACQADELRYDIMSSFKQRLEGSWMDSGNLEQSISNAGLIERSAGTEFAGCDSVIINRQTSLDKTGYLSIQGLELFDLSRKQFESKRCPNCLPKPKPGKKVKAWRQGDKIGCGNCGHVVDVCTRAVVKKGKKQSKSKSWLW